MRVARYYFIIVFTSTVLACSGCGWMPKVKIPFTGHGAGNSPASDPKLSYTPNQTLAPGHTLKLSVWSGQSSPSKIYDGSVMINDQGIIHFKQPGDIKVGGLTALQGVKAIEAAFHRHHEHSASVINVQLSHIEDVPLVTITGSVHSPAVIQWFDHISAGSALPYVGGRTSRSEARAIYVIRKGARLFHASAENVPLQPGDIVNFSSDL